MACWVAAKFLFYGLMQCSPYEIKDKLLKALDEDNNVSLARFIPFVSSCNRGVCSVAGRARKASACGQNANVTCGRLNTAVYPSVRLRFEFVPSRPREGSGRRLRCIVRSFWRRPVGRAARRSLASPTRRQSSALLPFSSDPWKRHKSCAVGAVRGGFYN